MGSKSYSKGISWINDCRIPHNEEIMVASSYEETKQSENGWGTKNRILEPSNRGRFPANILVSDDMLNDGVVSGENKEWTNNAKIRTSKIYGSGKGLPPQIQTIKTDKGTNSRYYDIDKWFDKILE